MISFQKIHNLKLKEKNQSKSRNKSISWKTTSSNKFFYELIKNHKLNELKEKAHRASEIMYTIGETYKPKKSAPKILSSDLNNPILTKINYRRSLLVQKKLKNIDKMNQEFDHEYINQRYSDKDDKHKNYESFSEDDSAKETSDKNDINIALSSEEKRILKILFSNNQDYNGNNNNNDNDINNRPYSEYKKFKKLKDLKSNIEYVCGIKLDEKFDNAKEGRLKEELSKNTHYYIPLKNLSFLRYKNDEIYFTPSLKYDKTKIYYEKNYDKFKTAKNDISSKYINYSMLSNLAKKNKNITKLILNKKEISPIRKNKNKMTFQNDDREELPKLENNGNDNDKSKSINNTKESFHKIKIKNLKNNNRNSYKDKFQVLQTENNISDRKRISLILKNLLKDNYSLKNDLKFGINLISSQLNDYKKQQKKKPEELNLDIKKIRKELKLDKLSPIIKESDIMIRNELKMARKLRKEEASILREVVNKILQEDRLSNKEVVINNNSLNNKLKKILERRVKPIGIKENEELENDKIQILKLFKNDNPDFFNMRHLSNLIKRYKTMKIK